MRCTKRLLETAANVAAIGCSMGLLGPALAQDTQSPKGGSIILPAPEPQFGCVIGRKATESRPDFPKAVAAPKGAPNVLLIMTDDTGFGASSTFGGPIPTPGLERVYQHGLCYN
jgi:Sulfatase